MVDLCSSPDISPCQTTPNKDHDDSSEAKDGASKDSDQSHHWFDRSIYPVRYYFVNFNDAQRVSTLKRAPSRPSTPARDTSTSEPPFIRDVQDCGALFDSLLDSVCHATYPNPINTHSFDSHSDLGPPCSPKVQISDQSHARGRVRRRRFPPSL